MNNYNLTWTIQSSISILWSWMVIGKAIAYGTEHLSFMLNIMHESAITFWVELLARLAWQEERVDGETLRVEINAARASCVGHIRVDQTLHKGNNVWHMSRNAQYNRRSLAVQAGQVAKELFLVLLGDLAEVLFLLHKKKHILKINDWIESKQKRIFLSLEEISRSLTWMDFLMILSSMSVMFSKLTTFIRKYLVKMRLIISKLTYELKEKRT